MTRLPFFALPPAAAESPAAEPPTPHSAHTFAVLMDLAGCAAEWVARSRPVLARCIKEDACAIIGRYFDRELTSAAANAALHDLHRAVGLGLLADDEVRAGLLAKAREHAGATAMRWAAEDWDARAAELPTPPSLHPDDVIDPRD